MAGTRQLCNSHPEKQLRGGLLESAFAASHFETPAHKEAPQTSSLLASHEKSIEREGKWNKLSLEADQTNESRMSSAKGKVSRGEDLHVALWESHWGGSIKEQPGDAPVPY